MCFLVYSRDISFNGTPCLVCGGTKLIRGVGRYAIHSNEGNYQPICGYCVNLMDEHPDIEMYYEQRRYNSQWLIYTCHHLWYNKMPTYILEKVSEKKKTKAGLQELKIYINDELKYKKEIPPSEIVHIKAHCKESEYTKILKITIENNLIFKKTLNQTDVWDIKITINDTEKPPQIYKRKLSRIIG